MPTINTISNQNNSSADQQNSHKTKETDVLTTNGTENQQRMTILETQVKLLTNAMSALTGVKTKNGVKKQKVITQSSTGRKRKRNSNNTSKTSPQKQRKVRKSVKKESPLKKKSKLSDNAVVDEDDDNSNCSLVPSPIAFTYNDMEDLKLLKSDLENLDAKDLKSVLRILQTTEPSIRCDNDENIEIDFEILKPETLIALRKFVSSCMLNNKPKKSKSSVNGSDSSKKSPNCDMTNDFSFKSDSYLYPSSARLSESSSDSESESSSDSESSDNNED